MIFANAASQKGGGGGGKGQCEYLIIYVGSEPTDESIEGFGGLSRFLHILPCL